MCRLKQGRSIPVDRMCFCYALFEHRFRRMTVSVGRKWPCQSTRGAGRVISVAMGFIEAESVTFRGGTLTRAFPSTHRRWWLHVVCDDKIRCYSGLCTRSRRRPKRIAVLFGRMPLRASRLVRSLWCVRRAKGIGFVLGRISFRGGLARLARLVIPKIDGIARLSRWDTHIMNSPPDASQ